jgi:hypothetical protein
VGYVVSPSGLADLVAALPLCGAANSGRSRLQSLLKKAKVHWPPMNAD